MKLEISNHDDFPFNITTIYGHLVENNYQQIFEITNKLYILER